MPGRRFLIALGGVFFLVVLIRTAWLSELSYLTLRTVEHAATGHGLRWNVGERVQVFDHPLWMLLLLGGRSVTGESYYTTFVLSLALSTLTAVLVLRTARLAEGVVLGTAMLALSWAIVSYSTSGLEGPLAHVLVVFVSVIWLSGRHTPRRVEMMAGLAGLAALTHVATLFITVPALIAAAARRTGGPTVVGPSDIGGAIDRWGTGSRWPIALLAGAPLLAWAVFATFYYGTPVPNSVVAELTEHAGVAARLHAAGRMFAFLVRHDPITLVIPLAAILLGVRDAGRHRPLAWGVIVYIAVMAVWAGDGMPGRWLALPCLVSTVLIVSHPMLDRRHLWAASLAAAAVLAAVPAIATVQSDVRFGTIAQAADHRDVRAADYPATGLLLDIRQWYPPNHPEARRGGTAWQDTNRVKTSPHPAFFGFAAGYGVHVIDRTGRTDPLLGRLPPIDGTVFPAGAARRVPDGYELSLPERGNRLADPVLAAYYDRVRRVTRGSLADPRRLLDALWLIIARPDVPAASLEGVGPAE